MRGARRLDSGGARRSFRDPWESAKRLRGKKVDGVLKLERAALVALGGLALVLIGLTALVSADEPSGVNPCGPVPVAMILTAPEQYGGREVRVRGIVMKKTRAVFPNGRSYYTLSVGDGQKAITVFSWADPSVERGDHVDVLGVFHLWRYSFRHMIESRGITKLVSP